MTLEDVRQQFRSGRLTKHEYIRRMHELHARVFEYPVFIRDSDIASITISPDGIILETKAAGVRLAIDSVDERLAPVEIINFGGYETDETAMLLRLAEGIEVVFDIGANIGWFSLNTARRYGSAADIYAFEPIPATYGQLVRNVELNGAQQSVHPNNFGFSDENSSKTFFYYPHGSGNASTADLSGHDDVEEIVCSVRMLDEYTRDTGILPGLIKCDVEGAELLVFRGGLRRSPRPCRSCSPRCSASGRSTSATAPTTLSTGSPRWATDASPSTDLGSRPLGAWMTRQQKPTSSSCTRRSMRRGLPSLWDRVDLQLAETGVLR